MKILLLPSRASKKIWPRPRPAGLEWEHKVQWVSHQVLVSNAVHFLVFDDDDDDDDDHQWAHLFSGCGSTTRFFF